MKHRGHKLRLSKGPTEWLPVLFDWERSILVDRQTQPDSVWHKRTQLYCRQRQTRGKTVDSHCRVAASDAVAVCLSSYPVKLLPAQQLSVVVRSAWVAVMISSQERVRRGPSLKKRSRVTRSTWPNAA